jgi:hypothetical protein
LFGPHPELAWWQDIVKKIKKTMKADISKDDAKHWTRRYKHQK